jgi:hypothetical protein
MADNAGKTGVQLHYGNIFKWWPWMWGAWIFGAIIPFIFNPKIEVDGAVSDGKRDTGDNFIATTAGSHQVRAWYRSGFLKHAGRTQAMTVDVSDGQITHVNYRAPIFAIPYLSGKLSSR